MTQTNYYSYEDLASFFAASVNYFTPSQNSFLRTGAENAGVVLARATEQASTLMGKLVESAPDLSKQAFEAVAATSEFLTTSFQNPPSMKDLLGYSSDKFYDFCKSAATYDTYKPALEFVQNNKELVFGTLALAAVAGTARFVYKRMANKKENDNKNREAAHNELKEATEFYKNIGTKFISEGLITDNEILNGSFKNAQDAFMKNGDKDPKFLESMFNVQKIIWDSISEKAPELSEEKLKDVIRTTNTHLKEFHKKLENAQSFVEKISNKKLGPAPTPDR